MGSRPLRQFYDHDRTFDVGTDLGPDVDTWRRHRQRFLATVRSLSEDQWKAPTRCSAWDTKDVLCHLITADGFWAASLGVVPAGAPPSRYLEGFDPSVTPDKLVVPMRDQPYHEVVEQFASGIETLERTLRAIPPDHWTQRAESPLGHLPARFVFVHALWDSWLHERDILVPLGLTPAPEPDELLAATWFLLLLGGLQGGLLDDGDAVRPGPGGPITATLVFDELPDHPLAIRYDRGVRIVRAGPGERATPAGSAVALVEGFTGRRPVDPAPLPADVLAQFTRASAIL
jgi:uncharacterized protein (TIGR03083 family)